LVDPHGQAVRAALACDDQRSTLETSFKSKNGRYRDVRLQLARVPALDSDEIVLFVIGADITEENALTERTKRAEKLASIGTLAAGLAHEIRNPLNGAKLHVAFLDRTLRRTGAADDVLEAVHVVGDEIGRLANLVTEFLDFARPRPLQPKRTTLLPLCERVLQLSASEASRAGVTLVRDFPSRDIELDADSAKLEQVLLNLTGNAIEAIEGAEPAKRAPDGGRVTFRVRRQPRHAVIEIIDDGPGLLRPDAPIFDAFFSTKPEGTGLGLAIAHRIVTDHQGSLTVESEPGATTFRVVVPLDAS